MKKVTYLTLNPRDLSSAKQELKSLVAVLSSKQEHDCLVTDCLTDKKKVFYLCIANSYENIVKSQNILRIIFNKLTQMYQLECFLLYES